MSLFPGFHRVSVTANSHFIRICNLCCMHCNATFLDDPMARSILGHDAAFAEVDFDKDGFDARGGRADYAPDQIGGAA